MAAPSLGRPAQRWRFYAHIPETMAAAIRIPPRETATSIPFATVIDALYSLACPSLPVLVFGFVVHLPLGADEKFHLPRLWRELPKSRK